MMQSIQTASARRREAFRRLYASRFVQASLPPVSLARTGTRLLWLCLLFTSLQLSDLPSSFTPHAQVGVPGASVEAIFVDSAKAQRDKGQNERGGDLDLAVVVFVVVLATFSSRFLLFFIATGSGRRLFNRPPARAPPVLLSSSC